jgi:hypothetical protein
MTDQTPGARDRALAWTAACSRSAFILRELYQLREWRLRLAVAAAQQRDQPVQRRSFMPIEPAQIDLLQLPAAGAEGIEEIESGGDRTPTVGHQGLWRAAPRCISLFQRVTDSNDSARIAASAYFSASRISWSMSLSDGRMPMQRGCRPLGRLTSR